MELIRHKNQWADPFDIFQDMDRLFSRALWRQSGDGFQGIMQPEMDITEEDNRYLLKVDLPGVQKKDVDINIEGDILTLKGERKEVHQSKSKNFHFSERRYGNFERALRLPEDVDRDKISADYKDGVLELTLPKSEKAKPKQIKVDLK